MSEKNMTPPFYNSGFHEGGFYNGGGFYNNDEKLFVHVGDNDYQYKKINNLYWTLLNLREPIGTLNTDYKKYSDDSLLETFGLYYQFNSLNLVENLLNDGWRIARRTDYNNLISFCGGNSIAGKKLKSNSNLWTPNSGTDEFNFAAQPAGDASPNFEHIGTYAHFLTSSSSYYNYCYQFYIAANGDSMAESNGLPRTGFFLPIRLCKDV